MDLLEGPKCVVYLKDCGIVADHLEGDHKAASVKGFTCLDSLSTFLSLCLLIT